MTTPPDRRATITEGDRRIARELMGSAYYDGISIGVWESTVERIAQSIADTREAAEARASILVRALEDIKGKALVRAFCEDASCGGSTCIASRALAEYAEAGAKKP